ncbi:MAG: hypothetical protein PHO14_10165, partial [Kiritimatiellae bacterium]|nr:hypothetical protein [Kiritimatiellia bacterium]MDD4342577.1 hypothetical protein [Kiritimatiellia bacterium]
PDRLRFFLTNIAPFYQRDTQTQTPTQWLQGFSGIIFGDVELRRFCLSLRWWEMPWKCRGAN